jgi:lipid A 3-O-deacylase
MRGLKAAFAIVVLAGLPYAAAAEDGFLSEIKLGALAHDVPLLATRDERGVDFNIEALFTSPAFLTSLGAPRPHVGASINGSGDTSQAYAGLTWEWKPFEAPVWGAFSFGGAIHDGERENVREDRKALGSRVLFRLAAEVGYDVSDSVRVSLLWDHISNAGLAEENEGLNNVGVRLGYRF